MKISDFFSNLPWRTDGNVSFLYLTPEQNRAIAIAVNNHDRLVEENKRMRDLLEQIRAFKKQIDEGVNVHGCMSGLIGSIDIIDETLSELGGE